ncbi:MAG TPA: AmmeMemoRadiSam system radical SAM enzyme, partial [Thermoplasmata archaeon]|nr:AmmeMemoRadiSam system radical SAM enzyme [Thermoplasmata archaeon]
GVHVEVTDLIVPEVGASEEATRRLARFVVDRLGPETPLHLLRFHPDYKMLDLGVTPVATLERLHAVAKAEGLDYVYLGNVWGHPLEHTYCPKCGAVAVERYGFTIRAWKLDPQNRCASCGHAIPIVGRPPRGYRPTFATPVG